MSASQLSSPDGTVMSLWGSQRMPPGPTVSGMADMFCAMTGTEQARLSASVRPKPSPRLVEMIDYERPAGWDVCEASGGRMPDTYSDANRDEKQFLKWVYQTFWLRDQNEVGGKPLNPQWRDPEAATGDKAAE